MVWLGTDLGWTGGWTLALAFIVTSAAGALMVSPFSYSSFKEIKMTEKISFSYALTLPLILIMVFINPPLVLCALAYTYALSGPLLSLWRRYRRQARRAAASGGAERREL